MKLPVILSGLALQILYDILAALSLGDYTYNGFGVGTAFALWTWAMLVASVCVLLYSVDAVLDWQTDKNKFHTAKLFAVLSAVPLLIFVGMTADPACQIVWNVFFAALFLFEIVCLFITPNAEHLRKPSESGVSDDMDNTPQNTVHTFPIAHYRTGSSAAFINGGKLIVSRNTLTVRNLWRTVVRFSLSQTTVTPAPAIQLYDGITLTQNHKAIHLYFPPQTALAVRSCIDEKQSTVV